jgi:transcriptional antiterminator NusG
METKIYSVRATAGQERVVAELLYREAKNKKEAIGREGGAIYSVLYATALKGYVLVEADSPGTVEALISGEYISIPKGGESSQGSSKRIQRQPIPKTRGLLLKKKGDIESAGTISIEELEKIIKPTPMVTRVSRGDLIELISGPFKGERARVAKVDESKNQITVELIEAAVPIPVIVGGDDIKTLEKQGGEEEDKKERKG